jgi:hypothetical protein
MHIWIVELKFLILFLLNTLQMIHYERILTFFGTGSRQAIFHYFTPIFYVYPCLKERTYTQF